MTFIVFLVIILVLLTVAQKFDFWLRLRQQYTDNSHRAKRAIPGTREHKLGEFEVEEPEPLPTVDEIVGYLWAIQHDRYFIRRFERK